jgi:hypothetical protein
MNIVIEDILKQQTGRIRVRRETITPEIATAWLEKHKGPNRQVRQSVVDRYARDMKNGKWLFTGDPIQFGKSGRLLNGQHRLWACIESDTSFDCLIVRGIENEQQVQDVIDTGTKRTLGNALQIHGEKDANNLSAIINMIWRYHQGVLGGPNWPTHEEGLDFLRENPDVRDAVLVARAVNAAAKIPVSAVGAAYYVNAQADPEASYRFWEGVRSGIGLEGGDPILALRRWTIAALQKRDRPRQEVWFSYSMKAMCLWREGRKIRQLHVKPEDGLPKPWK